MSIKQRNLPPFIAYRGGKSRLAEKIVKEIPKHTMYVEPMVGGGSVYFAKESTECKNKKKCEVIADVDKSLMNFYKTLKSGKVEKCNLTPSRHKLKDIQSKRSKGKPLSGCDYLYLNKLSFGGTGTSYSKGRFEKCKGKDAKKCGIKTKKVEKYKDRMKNTKIENSDLRKTITKHDSKGTVFYIDPPYAETNRGGYVEKTIQPEHVKQALNKIKGKVILSYNDTKKVREAFCKNSKYNCKKVNTTYTMSNTGNRKVGKELIIKNFKAKK